MASHVLELAELRKRYGDLLALRDLSFSVGPGEIYGFVGPNGAGKTTAMRIILGVLAADSGRVLWRGEPISRAVRQRIGYMPEERGLYQKMAAAEQLSFLAQLHVLESDAADRAAADWLERLGLGERAGDRVESLSLGNQQRVQLAAALVHAPELLVLDEPFSGLDPVGVEVLAETLLDEARQRGVPVLFSSHQLELVERLCDGVAIINDGALIASGGLDELRSDRGGRRWRVEVEGPSDGWWQGLTGVRRLAPSLFELDHGTDPEALLDAARRGGRVRRYHADAPSLSELFRDAVATPAETEPGARR